jgi:calcineurin B family protein 1
MGNSNSLKLSLQPEEIKAIEDDTGFTLGQISRLHCRFTKLDQEGKGYLEREDLLAITELAINPLGDRIVHAFFYQSNSGLEEEKLDFQVCYEVLK